MSGLLRSEWTKLRSVLGTAGCLLAIGGALVAVALLISAGNPGTYGDTGYVDEFRFAHRPLTGDGTLVARVRTQEAGQPWAMAGIMVKERAVPGAPYAALMVTAGHGVWMKANFTTDLAGSASTAPRYLRLTRAGETVTGFESSDGTAWTEVGSVKLHGLPPTVEVGPFVTSPGLTRIAPMRPTLVQVRPGTATFEAIALDPPQPLDWTAEDVGGRAPAEPVAGGSLTLTGSGDIIKQTDDGSRIVAATAGTLFAVLPAIALGTLAITPEYRFRTMRTTLAASPRRGRVLAAKAAVVAAATFPVGLVATLAALLLSQPVLRHSGYRPPVYPDPSPLDPAVLRAVAGTAALLTLLALLGLGVGAILRRTATTITLLAAVVFVPTVVAAFLPDGAATWLHRLTALPMLCGYTAVVLLVAYVRQRRADA